MKTFIPTWSFSRIQDFEQCKRRAKLKYLDKIPEPERPLPPGKTEHANDRGTRIHDAGERFARGGIELIPELQKFKPEFERLKALYATGNVSLEGEWAMDRSWEPVAWASSDAWLRLKLDALVFLSPTEAVAIDYKTGKRFGNEVKHNEQLQLYQLVTFLRYPKLETIHVELWYLDVDELVTVTYTRNQGLRFRRSFENRGNAMTTCTEFPPNPNIFSCKWCPYKGTEHCDKGV
jgi:RecB family exonuclease